LGFGKTRFLGFGIRDFIFGVFLDLHFGFSGIQILGFLRFGFWVLWELFFVVFGIFNNNNNNNNNNTNNGSFKSV
jgi:hypothetical protein